MKSIKEILKEKTGQEFDFNYHKLATKYSGDIIKRRQAEQKNREEYERNEDICSVMKARASISERIQKEAENIDGSLPICSVDEALTIIKQANKDNSDIGVNNLETLMMNRWRENRNYEITAGDFLRMKDHFEKNYPNSKVSKILNKIGSEGYMALPSKQLIEIASRIACQEDYDFEIRAANLEGNSPNQKKARKFILAIINGENNE
jgi:hypothetical protein